MRRTLLALLTVGLLVSCQDGELPTVSDRPDAGAAISDGSGSFEVGNSHFFWLAPMVSQPDESLFGTFDPSMQPTVRIVCWEDSDPNATCDPETALMEFSVGSGLLIETDHYKVEFDTQAPDPALRTSSGDTDFTTYRIQVLTPPMERFGGPFVFGFADFQLAENGKEARNLDSGETIGLVDGRTLPIKFRLDEGALEEELEEHTAPTDDPTGAEAFCQINCSVTVIDPDEPTLALLADTATDDTLTAMLIPAGAVWTDETSVLVIDERVDDGDTEEGEECLTASTLRTEACFRYELLPDNPNGDDFTEDVRFGICPEGQAVSSGTINPSWRLLKADEDNGGVVITRPDEVDVTDFLQCDVQTTAALWDGPGGQLAGSALQWLVAPLDASDLWGGQLRDLSDLFWGEDVEMSRLAFPASTAEGDTLELTVELLAIHADSAPVPGRAVTFTRTVGTGDLAGAQGFTVVGTGQNSVTLETDGSGRATVRWVITDGSNRLEATSPDARPASGEPDPVAFDVTGIAAAERIAFTSDRSGDSDLWLVGVETTGAPVPGTLTQVTTNQGFDNGATWSPDGSHIAFHSDRSNAPDLDLWALEVDATGSPVAGSLVQVTSGADFDRFPTWSPDGSLIAFDRNQNGNTDIWVVEVDATGAPQSSPVRATTDAAVDNVPAWSPNGSLIGFVSARSGNNSDIWVVEVDATGAPVSGSLVQVTTDTGNDSFLAWSPNGSLIAFTSNRSGNLDIWVVEVDPTTGDPVSSPVQVTTDQGNDSSPSWSPDGSHITFHSDRGSGARDVWAVEVNPTTGSPVTGSLMQVTTDAADDFSPAWSTIP